MTTYVGHQDAEKAFLESYAKGKLHHAWLLAGPKGLGKSGFAKRAALFLLDQQEDVVSSSEQMGMFANGEGDDISAVSFSNAEGSSAAHLVEAGSHPEYILLERKARDKSEDLVRNITIDQVRELTHRLTGTPTIARFRVCIVDAIDDLERSAANALLKTLEEPPRDTIFFLISHAPGRLLPTIRSRCRILRFNPLDDQIIDQWLATEMPAMPRDERSALIVGAKGAPGRALAIADLGLKELTEQLQNLIATGDPDNSKRYNLAKMLNLKAGRQKYEAMLTIAPQMVVQWTQSQTGPALAHGVETWERLNSITQYALQGSYDVAMTSYEIGSLLAGLAHPPR